LINYYPYELTEFRQTITIELNSEKIPKEFIIAINKTFQTRRNTNLIFARVDLGSKIHTNPNGNKIDCPHIHIQTEKYADKWASELPKEFFADTKNSYFIW
jgi:hypothetical protein